MRHQEVRLPNGTIIRVGDTVEIAVEGKRPYPAVVKSFDVDDHGETRNVDVFGGPPRRLAMRTVRLANIRVPVKRSRTR